ncbi:hypothetical protein [Rheinheimera maricola]|uniref:DUF3102 domain-containing protein n=1 Tax=Rheinheimera maricola TaxID=2793282 RepID=A0ABS7X5F5_9GAMM|nr:hypothetical protein [Rheinheimera maricola]MBZ9610779.1 hypothetical protein [Rheinheimera maricola]
MPAKKNTATTAQMDDLEAAALDMETLHTAPALEVDDAFHAEVEEHTHNKALAELSSNTQNTAALLNQHNEERDTLNQIIGQIQMTEAISKLTTVVGLSKLAHIKQNRMYKALSGKKGLDRNGNEIADVGTWEGFCLAVGTTRQKADEDILNLRTFGEEALENLTRIGAGYRELRQYRKLPADQKEALIEVAKTGDKETFIDLAEEIISKHTFEKAELINSLEEAKADHDAQGELLARKSKELDDTRLELEKTRRRIQTQTPDALMQQLHAETGGIFSEMQSLFKLKMQPAFEALAAAGKEHGTDQRQYMTGLLQILETHISALRDEFDLPDNLTGGEPDWMSADALANAEALVAAQQAQLEQ